MPERPLRLCFCATYQDGSRGKTLCPEHADTDPCLTKSLVTGKRRKGTIKRGTCTSCGWTTLIDN